MKRPMLMGGAVAILIVANAWRWLLPSDEPAAESAAESARAIRAERPAADDDRLRLPLLGQAAAAKPVRDPFKRGDGDEEAGNPSEPAPEVPESSTPEPRKDEEALAREAAQRGLRSLRLAGTVERDGERAAYIVHREEAVVVRSGGVVDGRFRVVTVDPRQVVLQDTGTGASRRLTLAAGGGQ